MAAIRSGSNAMMRRRSLRDIAPQPAISSSVRPQPRHSFEPDSSTQIFRQGVSIKGGSIKGVSIKRV
jgi:hypothetical protein